MYFRDHARSACRRTLSALIDAGADALIATSPSNIRYLTGYTSIVQHSQIINNALLILTREGKRKLIIPRSDYDLVSMNNCDFDEVHTFGDFYINSSKSSGGLSEDEWHLAEISGRMQSKSTCIDELLNTLESDGLHRARIVIDKGHLSTHSWELIQARLPKVRLLNTHDLMLHIRAIKTPYEIEMLRLSSSYTESAILASLDTVESGTTDLEISAAFKRHLINAGADLLFSAIGIGSRTSLPNVQPNGSRLVSGSLIRYDVGCRYQGYCSDVARIVSLGPCQKKARQYYEAMVAGADAAIENIKPGVHANEIFNIAIETVRKNGVANYKRNHCGHAIGLDMYEFPLIHPDDDTTLESGMVFCIETPYYELGFGGIQVESMVLVTNEGAEKITALGHDLIELAV